MQEGHRPLNAQAAKVMRPGVTYEPSRYMPTENRDQRAAPAVRHPDAVKKHLRPLIGFSYARVTIIGLSADDEGQWVVRCRCGLFGFRSFSEIANLKNDQDSCNRCYAEMKILRKEMERRLGRAVHPSEVPGACSQRRPLPAGVILSKQQRKQMRANELRAAELQREIAAHNEAAKHRSRRVFEAPEQATSTMALAFARAKS